MKYRCLTVKRCFVFRLDSFSTTSLLGDPQKESKTGDHVRVTSHPVGLLCFLSNYNKSRTRADAFVSQLVNGRVITLAERKKKEEIICALV